MIFSRKASRNQKPSSHSPDTRRQQNFILPLEPRIMFDAAALPVADAVAHEMQPVEKSVDAVKESVTDLSRLMEKAPVGPESMTDPSRVLVVIDPRIADYREILAGLAPGAQVLMLDPTRDGISQITSWLSSHTGITSLQILTQGAPGRIVIENSVLTADIIAERASDLAALFGTLTDPAAIPGNGQDVDNGNRNPGAVAHITQAPVPEMAPSASPLPEFRTTVGAATTYQSDVAPDTAQPAEAETNGASAVPPVLGAAPAGPDGAGDASHVLVVIDTRVSNCQEILAGVAPGAQVLMLDPNRDGIDQISAWLSGHGDITSVQILSHGTPGRITLGSTLLTTETVTERSAELAGWSASLTEQADILLYGCDVAAGSEGAVFIGRLAQVTGADVAASTNATGSPLQGGDWILESSTGPIESRLALTSQTVDRYQDLLTAPVVTVLSPTVAVLEPSTLNAAGASSYTLSGWAISDDGVGSASVSVDVVVANNAVGTLANPGGAMGGTVTAIAGGYRYVGTPGNAQGWVNQLTFSAADTELGKNAATTTVTVTVTDGETPALSSSQAQTITVTPSNDPVIVPDGALSVIEGSAGTVVTAAALAAADPEVAAGAQSTAQIVYRLTAAPTHGYLTLGGARIGVGSIFTQAQVNAGSLVYVHTGSGADQNAADSFAVSVNDGATPQADSDTASVAISITPVNQAPTVSGGGAVYEGQPANAMTSGVPQSIVGNFITATGGGDDDASALTVRITSLTTHGTLYYNGTATINGVTSTISRALTAADLAGSGFVIAYVDRAGLTYANDGVDPGGVPPDDGFGVAVTDGGGGLGAGAALTTAATINLDIRAINDDPAVDPSSTLTATVDADGVDNSSGTADDFRVVFTTAMLNVTDLDSPDTEITFSVTQLPVDGNLMLNGVRLVQGSTFTMDDVVNGRLIYGQTAANPGGANPADQFQFRVVDNALSLRWDANGEDFTRVGGVYDGPASTDPLKTFTFSLNLVETPTAPTNNGGTGTGNDIPAPAPDAAQILYSGDDPTKVGDEGMGFAEGGTSSILGDDGNSGTPVMLRYTAQGVPTTQIVYTVTGFGVNGVSWNGDLQLDGVSLGIYDTFTQADVDAGRLRYVHDGGEDFQQNFGFQVSAGGFDPGTGLARVTNGVFTLFITPVNDAPTVSGSTANLISEGDAKPITTTMLSFGDPDDATSESYVESPADPDYIGDNYALNHGVGGGDPLQFRIADLPDHGTLQYDTTGSGNWVDITAADVTGGTLYNADIITAAAGTTRLRYIHDGFEDRTDSFQVISRDRRGAESGPATVSFVITNVNDGPEIAATPSDADPSAVGRAPNAIGGDAANDPLTVAEGGIGQITSSLLQGYDPDSTDEQVQFRITTGPALGRLAYSTNGVTFQTIGIGSAFTQHDVASGYIYYLHDGTESAGATPEDTFGFTIADGDKEQAGNTFHILVTPTNDAPAVTGPGSPVDIDGASAADNPVTGFVIADPDLVSATTGETDFVQATVRLLSSGGTAFGAGDYTGIVLAATASNGDGDGTAAIIDADKDGIGDYLVIRGSRADVNATLATLGVSFPDDRDQVYQLQVIVDDRLRDGSGTLTAGANGGLLNQVATPSGDPSVVPSTEYDWYSAAVPVNDRNIAATAVTLRASSVNDPATLTVPGAQTPTEDTAFTFSQAAGNRIVITDAESTAFDLPVQLTLSVADGIITVGSQAGVTVSGNGTNTVTLTGTVADIQACLDAGFTYQGSSNFNGTDSLTVTLDEHDAAVGGDTGSGSVKNPNLVETVSLDLIPVNDAPTLTAPTTVTLSSGTAYTFSGGVIAMDDAADLGQGAPDSFTVTLTATGTDTVTLSGTAGLAFTTGDGTADAVMTFSGTRAAINAALNGLVYTPADANSDTTRTLSILVNDNANGGTAIGGIGGALTASRTVNLQVSAINEAPILSVPAAQTTTEDTSRVFSAANGNAITVADSDDFGGNITVTLSVPTGSLTLGATTGLTFTTGDGTADGTMTFSGTESAVNTALNGLTYIPPANFNSTNPVTLSLSVNDNGHTGTGGAQTDSRTIDITVTPFNDAPTRTAASTTLTAIAEDTANPAGDTVTNLFSGRFSDALDNQTANSGSSANSLAGIAITANAATAGQGTWQYSTDGGVSWTNLPAVSTANAFIVAAGDSLRFLPAANYNGTPGSLTTRLIDDSGGAVTTGSVANVSNDTTLSGGTTRYSNSSNAVTLGTSVSPVNDAPTITGPITGTTYTENAAAVILASGGVVADAADSPANFNGGTLRASFAGYQAGDVLQISANGTVTLSGGNVLVSGTIIGTYAGGTGSDLVITLNSNATAARINTVLQRLAFQSTSDDPTVNGTATTRALTITFDDGGNTGAGGSLNSQLTGTITITPAQDAPVITTAGGAASYTENTAAITVDNTVIVTDADDMQITGGAISITGGFLAGDVLAVTDTGNITGSYDAGTGVLTLTGADTLANYQSVLRSLTYLNSTDDPTNNTLNPTRTVTYSLTDADSDSAGAATGTATRTINVTAINDVPVTAVGGGAVPGYTENGAAVVLDSGFSVVSDADDTQIASATVQITGNRTTGDTLNFVNQNGITGSYNSATGLLTLTGTTSLANYQTALRSITFSSTSDDPTVNNSRPDRTITWTVTDANSDGVGAQTSAPVTTSLNVTAVNDSPVIGGVNTNTVTYTENGAAVVIDQGANATVTDADDSQIASAVIRITGNLTSGDTLNFTNQNGITGSYDAGTGTLTLTGSATLANYQTALRTITFSSTSDDPTVNGTVTSRTVTWQVTDADSDAAGAQTSSAVTSTITITPAQDAPVVTAGGSLAYTENQAAQVIDATVTVVSDADDTQMASATVQISAGLTTGDVLAVNGFSIGQTITGTNITVAGYNSGTGLLTLTGTDTLANYTAVLRMVTFVSTSDDPTGTSASRTITWRVTDANSDSAGAATSAAVTSSITVTPINDAPTVTAGAAAVYTENGAAAVLDGTLTVGDADDTQIASATVQITGNLTAGDTLNFVNQNGITGSYNSTTGQLTLTGTATLANYQAALRSVTFSSSSDDPTVNATVTGRTITWQVTDANSDGVGAQASGTVTSTITITPAQDAPVITPAGGAASYTENTPAISVDPAVTVTDADDTQITGGSISISSGFLAGDELAVITAGTGITAVYDAGTGVVTLTGTDTLAHYQGVLRSLTFLNSTDDPTNNTLNPTRTITYSLTDADSDGAGAAAGTATKTINVTAINDVPVTAVGGGAVPGYMENGMAVVLDNGFSVVSDADDTQIASATVQITGNRTTGDTLNFVNQNGISGSYNATTGTLTLTGTTTLANYQAALRSITFSSSSDDPTVNDTRTNRTITWTVSDANSDGVGAQSSIPLTSTITVSALNDPPAGVDDAVTVGEAGGLANGTPGSPAFGFGNVLTNDTDPDSGDIRTVSAVRTGTEAGSGTAGTVGVSFDGFYGSLILNSDGSYLYVLDNGNAAVQALRTSGQTLTETFTYTVKDSADATDTAQLTITIQGANDNPVGVNDTASAVEAGGIANGTPGSDGTGNVLVNDTDVDSAANGETGAVNAIRTGAEGAGGVLAAVAGGTTSADGTSVIGSYGTLTLGADGSYRYIIDNANPTVNALAAGAILTETFTYRIVDASGATDTAELTVTITGANDNPVGVDNTATAVEAGGLANGTAGSNPFGNVLTNDTDVDSGDTRSVSAIRTGTEAGSGTSGTVGAALTGTYGTLTLLADGTWSYDVDNGNAAVQALRTSGQTLTETFTYTVKDSADATDTAQLTITIQGANDNPVGVNDTASAVEAGGIANGTPGSNGTGNVLANDSDVDSAANGETGTVNAVRTGAEGAGGVLAAVAGGTTSADGTSVIGSYGTLTLGADGSYRYVIDNANPTVNALAAGAILTETFTYRIVDASGATDTAELTVTITGANDNPVAVNDTASTDEDTAISRNPSNGVLPNDSDVDSGTTLVVAEVNGASGDVGSSVTGTNGGSFVLNADGSYSFDPGASFQDLAVGQTRTTSVAYTTADGAGGTATAILTITVVGTNDNPVGSNVTGTAVEAGGIANGTAGTDATGNVLTNDTDVDSGATRVVSSLRTGDESGSGSAITLGTPFSAAYGAITLNSDGSYTYVVDNDNAAVQALQVGETLTETFTYTLRDEHNAIDTAQLTITIQGANDAPVANPDSAITSEDTPVVIDAVADDTDIDGDTLSVTHINGDAISVGTPIAVTNGSVELNANGRLTFTPEADFHGTASFTYTVSDGHGGTSTSTVNVTVNPVVDIADDTATTNEGTAVTTTVLANDSFEGTPVVTAVTQGANGTVTINADNTVTYTPNPDFNGTDSYTYTVTSPTGVTETATVNVTVNPIADITDDTAVTNEDTAVTTTVLANDSFEGTPVVTAVTQGAHGTVTINADNTITYTPNFDFNGTDSYTYTVTSPTGVTETATVNVTVNPIADIADDTATTNEDTAVTTTVLSNDSFEGTPVVTAVTQGANGTVTINADNTVTYTPNPDFNGTDSYTYTVTSPTGVTETATVNVTVNPVADIVDDTAVTNEDTAVTTTVLANDSFEGTPVVTAVTQGANGTVTINADNTVTYTPNPDFNGTDSYTYTVTSPTGLTETATVNVTLNPVADIVDDTAVTNEDTAVTAKVLTNDSFEGTPVVMAVTQGANGTVTINADNTVTYTPNPDFNGTDSYTYTVTSPTGVTETATVNVTVNPIADIADDTATTNEDTAVTTTVLANDSFEGTPVVTSVTQGANGTVTINADNTVTYTPDVDFNGTDSYTYTVTSPTGVTETATVNVTVNPVADIADDTATTNEDTAVTTTVLANDSFEGTPVVTLVTQGANGTVTINADNTVTYKPDPDFNGTDSYTYTVTSPTGVTETATVNVTVNPIVDIADDTATTNEDTAVTTTVLANDSFEGTPVVTAVTQGANGTVTINADNTVTYMPNPDFHGTDSYTYSVTSGGVTETATVNVTVNPVVDIADDTATTNEDTAVTTTVLSNDSFEGTPVVTAVTQGAHGTVTINPDNTVTYTPNADFNGTDSYTYTVTSPSGITETATVNVTVNPVADIADDTETTNEDTAVTTMVLANDSFEGTPVVTAVTQGANGTVVINPDNTVTYTPNADFNGTDSYTYTVTSPTGITETATVNVTVNPVADIADDTAITNEDTAVTTTVLSNDSFEGTPVVTAVTQGANGTVVINPDNTVTYTPNVDYNGTDSYTYTVTSPTGVTETATVNVTVNPVVDIADDIATTNEDTPVTTTVLANDSFEGIPVVTAVTQGSHGTVVINPDNTVTYRPNANFNGTDSYTYTVTSPTGVTETATVTVTVNPVNDLPTLANDHYITNEDTPLTVTAGAGVLSNDSDVEGPLTIVTFTQPANGAVSVNTDGSFSYTPNANFNGTDVFTYTVIDSNGATGTATVHITVNPLNDAPSAVDDAAVTVEDTPLTLAVLGNDSDIDGNALSITRINGTAVSVGVPVAVTNGSVTLNADGTLTFVPTADFNGQVSFSYTISDGHGGTSTATATLSVTPAPDIADDTDVTNENTPVTTSVLANDNFEGTPVVTAVTQGANGTVVINPDNTVTYTPDPDYSGQDSYTYTITSGGVSETATVTVTVKPVYTGGMVTPPAPEPPLTPEPPPVIDPLPPPAPAPLPEPTPDPVRHLEELEMLLAEQDSPWLFLYGDYPPGCTDGLYLRIEPPPQEVIFEKFSRFQLPQGIFGSCRSDARVSVTATLPDDEPLPPWLTFNEVSGVFFGTAPPGTPEVLLIKLTAQDERGHRATATFTLRIIREEQQMGIRDSHKILPDLPADEQSPLSVPNEKRGVPDRDTPAPKNTSPGRQSLSEQFARHGRHGLEVERQQMMRTLQKGFAARRG